MSKATDNQQDITSACSALQKAGQQLDAQIDLCPPNVDLLTDQYEKLTNSVSALLSLQNQQDDAVFAAQLTSLKSITVTLKQDAIAFQGVIKDINALGSYLSDLHSALTFIAKIG
jgi:hypothetical protein